MEFESLSVAKTVATLFELTAHFISHALAGGRTLAEVRDAAGHMVRPELFGAVLNPATKPTGLGVTQATHS